jgi:hypothetical protein
MDELFDALFDFVARRNAELEREGTALIEQEQEGAAPLE